MVSDQQSGSKTTNVYAGGLALDPGGRTSTPPDVISLVGRALKEGYQITSCPECRGPLVHAKRSLATRCFRCGHGTNDPSRVEFAAGDTVKRLRAMNGRLTSEDIVNDSSISSGTRERSSFRRCKLCKAQTMTGRPLRMDYCAKCAALSPHERSKRLRWKTEASHTVQTEGTMSHA